MTLSGLAFGWRGTLIIGALCFATGFGTCWRVRDLMAAESKLKTERAATQAANKTVTYVNETAKITAKVSEISAANRERIRTVTQTLIEKVPVYVPTPVDGACPNTVPVGFVRLHDAAAAGIATPVPDPAGRSNDTASDVALPAVAATVTQNYGICRQDQERLGALQGWIRQQARLAGQEIAP